MSNFILPPKNIRVLFTPQKILWLLLFVTLSVMGVQAQITGAVFRDYNADGVKQTTEPLITGVIVKAYTAANAECATTTTTTVAKAGHPLRWYAPRSAQKMEFTPPAAIGIAPYSMGIGH